MGSGVTQPSGALRPFLGRGPLSKNNILFRLGYCNILKAQYLQKTDK